MIRSRVVLGSAVAVAVCSVLAPIPTPVSAAVGGLIQFQSPQQISDTRTGPPVLSRTLGSNMIVQVTVLSSTLSAGQPLTTVAVHPCNLPAPAGEATFVLRPDAASTSAKVILGATTTCLTASLPIHVIVDKIGTVLTSATPLALQYVALASPAVVLDGTVAPLSTTPLPAAAGVPGNAKGLVVSLNATDAANAGYLAAYDCATSIASVADVGYQNTLATGLAYVPFNTGGSACVFSSESVHVKATVLGYFTDNGPNTSQLPPSLEFVTGDVTPPGLRALTPLRVLDTRNGIGRPGTTKVPARQTVQLSFGSSVASTTTSVVLNVTASGPSDGGFITAYPCDRTRPTTSNLNYVAGDTVPNLVVVKLAADRTVCLYTEAATHILADLTGTFETQGGARGKAVAPTRILDTRTGIGAAAGKVPAGQTLALQVTGHGDVPLTGAVAATLNITAVGPDDGGYLTVWPCDQPQPTASSLNFVAGDVVPNLVTTRLSVAGTVCIFTTSTVHLLGDVGMWFGNAEVAGFKELVPDRLLDTRSGLGASAPGKLAALGTIHLAVASHSGVPLTGVTAVALNMTAVGADGGGYVTAWPCDQTMPVVSNLNFEQGQTVPNAATVKLAADGTICLFTTATTHLLVDVAGYYTGDPDTGFVPTIS